jgi:hypothetical protein
MSLGLVRAVADAETDDSLHLARLLLLLGSVHKGSGKSVEGITKLAKLDFLLRYPNCLERALRARGKRAEAARVEPQERTTIESKMIRFRYGPWDGRYRRWIGLLVARELAETFVKGVTVHVRLTEQGRALAGQLAGREDFHTIAERSDLIVKEVGKLSATRIKDFVYEVFPELSDMKWGEEIVL